MRANMQIRQDVSFLELQLSDQNLHLIQEYKQRIQVFQFVETRTMKMKIEHNSSITWTFNLYNVKHTACNKPSL